MSDPRFARLRTDPRFRKPKRSQQKVVVDERFKSLFDDGRKGTGKKSKALAPTSISGGRVDKYGRRISDTHEKDNLRRFYRLEGEDEEKSEDAPKVLDLARGEVLLESSDEAEEIQDDQESTDEEDVVLGHHISKPIPVLADEDDLEVDLDEDDDAYADLDAQAAAYSREHAEEQALVVGSKTNRLAVVNLDWDHVRSSHLYKIFSSLVSPTAPSASVLANATIPSKDKVGKRELTSTITKVVRGNVLSVRIYPSEFGRERMEREEVEGPPKEIFKKSRQTDDESVFDSLIQDEGNEYDEKALRKYQLERLRYYYAIVTCDTVEAASHILFELDGTELERSANVLDLSFVPDDMAFDEEFRDESTPETEAAGVNYKGLEFSTDALRHSKVSLKWEEDDPERNKIMRRALSRKEIEEGDYREYIASSGSEDADEGKLASKNSKAGGGDAFGDGEDEGGDMEITFLPGLSEANAKDADETTLEKYKRRQKEKRQERKERTGERKPVEGKNMKGVEDEFFGEDGSSEDEAVDVRKKVHAKKKDKSESPIDAPSATEAELELLVAPDGTTAEHKHFDMKSILKAEKAKGKKKRIRGKKKDRDIGADEIQEDFQINVKDERFKALHEDHTFAIDPSNPQFKKTKSMAALLDERSKRRQMKEPDTNEGYSAKNEGTLESQSLQSLVESVKRKSSQIDGKGIGKRRKI